MAFGGSGEMIPEPVPTTAEDFHGDGMDSEIAVIRAYSQLGDWLQPSEMEQGPQIVLQRTDMQPTGLYGDGLLQPTPQGSLLAPNSFMGSSGTMLAPLRSSPTSTDFRLLSLAPQSNPGLYQYAVDRVAAYPVPDAQELRTIAGTVFLDELISIESRTFAGHVYNLQTSTGWYIAEGIITHNCMCRNIYRTAELHVESLIPAKPVMILALPPGGLPDLRCSAGHLVAKDATPGAKYYCRKCKLDIVAPRSNRVHEPPLSQTRQVIKTVERDGAGRIARVIEEHPL